MKTSASLLCTLLSASPAMAEVPNSIPHQGRIAVSGTNFDGIGQFKFLLFSDPDTDHSSGNETAVWSNSSSSPANLTEPPSAVSVPVAKGLYGTWLGDATIPNMATLPPSIEPTTGSRLYLRIWFNSGAASFEALAPDQTISSVPFALHAASVAEGGVSSASIADGAITGSKLATGSISSASLADSAVTTEKIAPGAVRSLGTPGEGDSLTNDITFFTRGFNNTAGLDNPVALAIEGNFAYVVDSATDKLQIFDIRIHSNIVARGSNQTNLANPTSVKVQGNIAFVLDSDTDRIQAFDVSDPDNIVARDFDQTGISNPKGMALQGNFAYVVDDDTDRIQIFDISDPNNIVAKGFDQTGLTNPVALDVKGDFAYVVTGSPGALRTFNISDPENIVPLGSITGNLSFPSSVFVEGNFAFVTDTAHDTLTAFDISDPNLMVEKDSITTSAFGLSSIPVSVTARDGFAFVVDSFAASLQVFDVRNPDQIRALAFTTDGLDFPKAVETTETHAYVINAFTDSIQAFELLPLLTAGGPMNITRGILNAPTILSSNITTSRVIAGVSVTSADFKFPSPKAFALTIPGCAMLPETASESFLRSQLGFIQNLPTGIDTNFVGTAPVSLPQGARVVGMDLMYLDNSVANSFTNFTTRLRRVNNFTTNVSAESVVALNVASPGLSSSPAIQMSSSDVVTGGTEIIDNENYQYFVMVNSTVTAPDAALRFYGFRIRYTLTTLAP